MKKFKRKWKYFFWLSLFILLIGLVVFFVLNNKVVDGDDFKLGIVANEGVALVSFSPERKMINVLKMDTQSKLWIPGGLGWYRNEVIKELLIQEDQLDKVNELFFYNFGFKPDKILFLSEIDDWKSRCWLRYSWWSNKMLYKEEFLDSDILNEENLLDELMIRDFAETEIVKEDLKLSVFNITNINGLASFMTRRLEWMGFSVISVETLADENDVSTCLIKYNLDTKKSLGWRMLNELMDQCEKKYDINLNDGEIELYFGRDFSSMIKYPSYYNL